jgi:hypothetical protein
MHPAAGTLGVAHAPPVPVFGGDLQRLAAMHEGPVDALVEARAAPRVRGLGPHRDEARDRQVGDRPAQRALARKRRRDRAGQHERHYPERAQAHRHLGQSHVHAVPLRCLGCREVPGQRRSPRAIAVHDTRSGAAEKQETRGTCDARPVRRGCAGAGCARPAPDRCRRGSRVARSSHPRAVRHR